MKKNYLLFLLLFLINHSFSQGECSDFESFTPTCDTEAIIFPAGVDSGDANVNTGVDFGCLATTPNPKWFYIKIATSGVLRLNESNSANLDVDGALWGPFSTLSSITSLCGDTTTPNNPYRVTPVAPNTCDYTISANFNFRVDNAQAGEYYVMLVTNYSNRSTNISIDTNGSTAALDCDIVDVNNVETSVCTDEDGEYTIEDLTVFESEILGPLTGFTITYHPSLETAEAATDPISSPYTGDLDVIYARVENNLTSETYLVATITVNKTENPTANNLTPNYCSQGTTYEVNLDDFKPDINSGSDVNITFHPAQSEDDPYPSTITVSDGDVIYSRVVRGDCVTYGTITFTVAQSTEVRDINPSVCSDTDTYTVTLDDLKTEVTDEDQSLVTITFHNEQNNENPLTGTLEVTNGQVFYARVQRGDCVDFARIEYSVLRNPTVTDLTPEYCSEDNEREISLAALRPEVTSDSGVTISFHPAENDQDQITNEENYVATNGEVLYARVANGDCVKFAKITISLEKPFNENRTENLTELCEGDQYEIYNGEILTETGTYEYYDEENCEYYEYKLLFKPKPIFEEQLVKDYCTETLTKTLTLSSLNGEITSDTDVTITYHPEMSDANQLSDEYTFNGTENTIYARISNGNCVVYSEVIIRQNQNFEVVAAVVEDKLCRKDGYELPDGRVVNENGFYRFYDEENCELRTYELTFYDCLPCKPMMPTAFTPNRNLKNDMLRQAGPDNCIFKISSFTMFNKWGNELLNIDGSTTWEQVNQLIFEKEIEKGTYLYTFEYEGTNIISSEVEKGGYSGTITILY